MYTFLFFLLVQYIYMSDITTAVDSIAEKKKEQEGTSEPNDWRSFFITCLQLFVTLLLVSFIGANFIYISTNDYLDSEFMFPTQESTYFPRGFPYEIPDQYGGYFAKEKCQGVKRLPNKYNLIGNQFPYNLARPLSSDWDFIQSFKNWLARSCADSYMTSRSLMRDYFSFFAPAPTDNIFANETFLMFFVGPMTLFLSFLVPLIGGVTTLFFSWEAGFWWWTFGLLGMWTYWLPLAVAVTQFVQFIMTLLFMPLIMDSAVVKTILHCNIRTITLIYGWLVCGVAFGTLDPAVAMVMSLVYCGLLVKMFWSDAKALVGL